MVVRLPSIVKTTSSIQFWNDGNRLTRSLTADPVSSADSSWQTRFPLPSDLRLCRPSLRSPFALLRIGEGASRTAHLDHRIPEMMMLMP